MAKKDFSKVMDTITAATAETQESQETQEAPATQEKRKPGRPRRTYSEYEAAEYLEAGRTSGRKGLKQSRINMAFSKTNYDYITTMARVSGMTLTDFVNHIVLEHLRDHEDLYKQALKFRDSI